MAQPKEIVSRQEWLQLRRDHLQDEKEFTRQRDQLAARRRALPWVKVDQDYVFDGETGPVRLSDLFEGRSQLIVYHFMFAPDWTQGCKSCSLIADHYNPAVVHLNLRDTSLVTVSRAPIEKLLAFRQRMGWGFRWVSSGANSFKGRDEETGGNMFWVRHHDRYGVSNFVDPWVEAEDQEEAGNRKNRT